MGSLKQKYKMYSHRHIDYLISDSISHPAHFFTEEEGINHPSALIPFCEFGGNKYLVSQNITQFNVPVCNCFKPKIVNDQLCHEADLNKFFEKKNVQQKLKAGFIFIMDYNEDRQVNFDQDHKQVEADGFYNRLVESDETDHASIYLNTIGKLSLYDLRADKSFSKSKNKVSF